MSSGSVIEREVRKKGELKGRLNMRVEHVDKSQRAEQDKLC